jgi:hypothetical protein
VRFLACWDCGPVGTLIAASAFAAGTVISYYSLKLAIWTANKDFLEHCQSDEASFLLSQQIISRQANEVIKRRLRKQPLSADRQLVKDYLHLHFTSTAICRITLALWTVELYVVQY